MLVMAALIRQCASSAPTDGRSSSSMCIMGPDILIEKNAAASGVLHMSFSRHLRREKQETFALPKVAWQSPSNSAGAMLAGHAGSPRWYIYDAEPGRCKHPHSTQPHSRPYAGGRRYWVGTPEVQDGIFMMLSQLVFSQEATPEWTGNWRTRRYGKTGDYPAS